MAMFSKLKQIKDLRTEAKKLQNTLAQETVTESGLNGNIQITMDGNQEVKNLIIAPSALSSDNKEKLEEGLKNTFNKSVKSVQKIMAKKMQEQGGLGNLGNMSDLLK